MPLVDINTLWRCETCYHDHYGRCTNKCGCDHGESYRPAYSKLKVVDAVPVVRCRECKHWKPTGSEAGNCFEGMEPIGGCRWVNFCRKASDFCSYGERVETAENSKKLASHSKGR